MVLKMIICRQKKKSISIWLLCVFCITVLGGCGTRTVETQNDNIAETTETTETIETSETAKTEETPASEAVAETVALTEQELEQWTKYVNSRENNAFLLSYYDEPKQIDLNELFYTGCGLDMEELTDKEVQEYLEWTGMDEVYTEFTRITGEQVASVLKLRLGLTMEEMEQPLEWCYLTDSDVYVMQHGDTNAQNFTCITGSRTGNQVVLDCLSQITMKVLFMVKILKTVSLFLMKHTWRCMTVWARKMPSSYVSLQKILNAGFRRKGQRQEEHWDLPFMI